MAQTRGVRNNNPGNIDFNAANKWVGQVGIELGVPAPRFARFDMPENGIRALAKLVMNYGGKAGTSGVGNNGIDTVREVINRWAPGSENNTEAYIQAVAKNVGVKDDQHIDLRDPTILFPLVKAIILHENGSMPYADSVIREGISRAIG